jgi:hypothetical protein
MIPSKYRFPAIAAGIALAIALASVAGFQLYSRRPPSPVTLAASVDPSTRTELSYALDAYNSRQRRFSASLLPEGSSAGPDLVLGPYSSGGLVWRSQGWRLWARLETLAKLEGVLKRPIILPLREGGLDLPAFESLLADIRGTGVIPITLPSLPASYTRALDLYLGKAAPDGADRLAAWTAKGWIRRPAGLRQALDAIDGGAAAFLLGGDSLGSLLSRSVESHNEGFPPPGSLSSAGTWVLGRADAFTFPAGSRPKAGAVDLVTYLTSKGLARSFGEKLPGAYYSWKAQPKAGQVPSVEGPSEFLDADR